MDDAITGMREGAPLGSAFTLIRAVGSGTVGTVWAVSRKGSWALYAAKFLKPEYHKDSEFLERFVRERTVLSQLHHQYIVPIEDMVVEGDNLAIPAWRKRARVFAEAEESAAWRGLRHC